MTVLTRLVPLDLVEVSSLNVRTNLTAGTEDGGMAELAASIKAQGLLNPPLLRQVGDGRFEVVAGQRRVSACRLLGWAEVPALVRVLDDAEALAASLAENVQRADMDAMDKARAVAALEEMLGSIPAVAVRLGLSVVTVRRYRSLLSLAPELQARAETGAGPAGVGFLARLAETFSDPADQAEVYDKVAGFTGGVASEIVRRCDGEIGAVDELVTLAIEGNFGRRRCGQDLQTCPFIPAWATAAISALIVRGPGPHRGSAD